MKEKLPKISKNVMITSAIIFGLFIFRTVFAFSQYTLFKLEYVPYILIAAIPFMLFIALNLSPDCNKDLKAVDIVAIASVFYTLAVILDDTVIRNNLLITVGFLSVILILCKNTYTLPVAALLSLLMSFKFGDYSSICIPAAICVSSVSLSYLFQKKAKPSAKKAKKAKASEKSIPAPNYMKERILFIVSELILFASLAVTVYYRINLTAPINFIANIKYNIPAIIAALIFAVLAVLSLKNKRPFTEFIGYAVIIASMPLSIFCSDFSIAAMNIAGALYVLLALCDINLMLPAAVYAEKIYGKITALIDEHKENPTEE